MAIVVCHKKHLAQRCSQRNVPLEVAMQSVVATNGDILSIDTEHPAYPMTALPKPAAEDDTPQPPKPPAKGPGTELKKLLAKIGIVAKPNCSCNTRARIMDERGPAWCEEHLDEIVGWLREEATKRKLPFVDLAGRMLVKRAIRNAQKATIQ
jgi:hypothetical protein